MRRQPVLHWSVSVARHMSVHEPQPYVVKIRPLYIVKRLSNCCWQRYAYLSYCLFYLHRPLGQRALCLFVIPLLALAWKASAIEGCHALFIFLISCSGAHVGMSV